MKSITTVGALRYALQSAKEVRVKSPTNRLVAVKISKAEVSAMFDGVPDWTSTRKSFGTLSKHNVLFVG